MSSNLLLLSQASTDLHLFFKHVCLSLTVDNIVVHPKLPRNPQSDFGLENRLGQLELCPFREGHTTTTDDDVVVFEKFGQFIHSRTDDVCCPDLRVHL